MKMQLLDFIDDVLRSHYGPEVEKSPQLRRIQVEKLLTDDGQRRLGEAERAAVEWGGHEFHGDVRIVSERMIVTPLGLVYAAGLKGLRRRPDRFSDRSSADPDETMYYLATPRSTFDSLVDHTRGATQRHRSVAVVDSRYGHELEFPWPLDAGLRRTFDDHEELIWI